MKRFWLCLLAVAFLTRLVAAIYWDDRVRKASYVPGVPRFTQTADAQTPPVDAVSRPNVSSSANANVPTDGPFFFGDSDSYWKLGRALAFGRPYRFDEERRWEIFRTPGYPALLAPLFWTFGENPPVFAARFLGVCFGTANVGLVGLLAFAYFRRRSVAALAGVLATFDPTLVFESVLVLSEEPFLTFALLQHYVALDVARRFGLLAPPSVDLAPSNSTRPAQPPRLNQTSLSPRSPQTPRAPRLFAVDAPPSPRFLLLAAFALGATSAATVYLRPSWLYALPFATFFVFLSRFFVFIREKRARRQTAATVKIAKPVLSRATDAKRRVVPAFLLVVAGAVVVFAVALAPWTLRNYRLTGRPVATSLQMGASLYDAWRPDADGASDMRFVDEFRRLETESPSGPLDLHFEIRLDERLKAAALDWARSNPDAVARLAVVKLVRLWSPVPREPAFSSPALQLLLATSFTPLLIGGLCGFYRSFRRRGAAWTLLVPAFYVSALHSIFVSSIRYRVPVLYGLVILTAFAVVAFLDRRRAALRRS